jgi:hypothetical protein
MTNGAATGGAAAAAGAAAIANAIKASGAIVNVESDDFETILRRAETPLVVCATGGVFSTKYYYLTSYKGLIFFTKTPAPLSLPGRAEVINAKRIWVPS